MNAIPDLAQRARALDPTGSFIVQAPAGSGKTELLIQRFLVLLARVARPEEIAAITFTRKAAAEMRKRIFEALRSARHAPRPSEAHEARTWDLAAAVLQKNDAHGWKLEESATRVRIQTIDSLCASLTRQMPVLAKFGAQPESLDDASALYLEAARATLALVEEREAVANDAARVLEHLDNNVARAEMLIADLLRRRDHWLRLLREADERSQLEAVLAQICRAANEHARGLFPASGDYALPAVSDIAAWQDLAERYLTRTGTWRLRALSPELAANDDLRKALGALRALPAARYSDEQWQVLGAILRLARVAVGELKLVFAAHRQADFIEIAQGALRSLVTEDGPTDLLLSLDYRIRHILVDEFQDTSYTQFELLEKLTSGWEPGDGRTLFVVGDPMQSIYRFREAEVGLFLRARHEGIGTVRLEPLTLSANFRSQAGIVEWVNATFSKVMPAAEDIATGAVPYTPSHAVHERLEGAVKVHAFFNGDRAGEARNVIELARAALEQPGRDPGKPSTAAILVRNRSHLLEIVPQLKAQRLRFRAIEIEALSHRPVVGDLLALTRALSHAADRTAWLAILRAPWCGLTLADLHALAPATGRRRAHERTLWEAMNDEARVATLSADGQRRLARVREVLAPCLAQRRRSALRDLVEGAWLALGGPACVEEAVDLEDAEAFLDYLESAEEAGSLPHLERFELAMGELYASPDVGASERLQVMTIHKAKGLEFDVVIVPGLGAGARADDRRLFVWMERPAAPSAAAQSLEFLLSPINPAGGDKDRIYEFIRTLDEQKNAIEDARLLYVAATRARLALHLLGDARRDESTAAPKPSQPKKDTLLHRFWQALEADFASAVETPAPMAATRSPSGFEELIRWKEGAGRVAPPPGLAWSAAAASEAPEEQIEFSWVGETARHVGSVVHRWLQRIAGDGLDRWSGARVASLEPCFQAELCARGVIASDLNGAAAQVVRALQSTLEDPRGRWALGAWREAASEVRYSQWTPAGRRVLVIDRTFIDQQGTRWIVDYKTSRHEGAALEAFLDSERERYRGQLEAYARAIGGSPSLGLYFPLVRGWRPLPA